MYFVVNISKKWIGMNVIEFFFFVCNNFVEVFNDVDVVGLVEMCFGFGKG